MVRCYDEALAWPVGPLPMLSDCRRQRRVPNMTTRTDDVPDQALELRSLVTDEKTVELFLDLVDVPQPGSNEILVRVEAAPINPSDLGLLFAGADVTAVSSSGTSDHPVVTAPLSDAVARAMSARVGEPLPAGNEGAGTVVAAGSSDAAQALLGKMVAAAGG